MPPAASIVVNALMSAPAQNSIGLAEANTSARTLPEAITASHTFRSAWTTSGEIEFAGGSVEPRDRDLAPRLELDRTLVPARVGPGVGEEALAGLDAEPALGDQPPQDRRRLEVLAPLPGGVLELRQHLVQPDLVGAGERRRDDPGAGHHPEVDVLHRRDALLEHEAALDERLEREAVDQRRRCRCQLAVLIEALSGLGAEIAGGDQLLHLLVDVEPIAV